jgi:hypothetical protein
MAQFDSTLFTAQNGTPGQSLNVSLPQQRDAQGKARCLPISYTCLGTEATGDTIRLAIVPLNSKVLARKSSIQTTATVGTGVTVRLGDSSDAARYMGTVDISAGGAFATTATAGTDCVTPTPITTEATRTILLTFVAISAITAGKVITVFLDVLTPE